MTQVNLHLPELTDRSLYDKVQALVNFDITCASDELPNTRHNQFLWIGCCSRIRQGLGLCIESQLWTGLTRRESQSIGGSLLNLVDLSWGWRILQIQMQYKPHPLLHLANLAYKHNICLYCRPYRLGFCSKIPIKTSPCFYSDSDIDQSANVLFSKSAGKALVLT